MNKATKIWFIIATALVLVGGVIFALTMSFINWDFLQLNTSKFETNEYIINEKFDDLSIDVDTADVNLILSEDDKIKVVCYEEVNDKHNVKVENKTLCITADNQRKWYDNIGFSFDTPKISVYLPKSVNYPTGEYGSLMINASTSDVSVPKYFVFKNIDINLSTGDVTCFASSENDCKISTSTGNIELENVFAKSFNLTTSTGYINAKSLECAGDFYSKVSTGEVAFKDIKCDNFVSEGTTGEIILEDVVANGKFDIDRSTGGVSFKNCDASEVYVVTSTGDVNGNFLTDKMYMATSDTGDVVVPDSNNGGKCEITSDTGSIIIVK